MLEKKTRESYINDYFCIFLRGAVQGSNTQEATDRLVVLKEEIARLDEHEKKLDQHKQVNLEMKNRAYFFC